ncbi:8-amino-7-oxononanoate synthase [Aggregicoccus sp. 17bor-14]|uniref:8-amino-7-oxononanoate synthase n=1 Tax=Myxococcaceae TaxID=31 RepID=UPI00129C7276|nr:MULTISPECIES: 8-amino-7-oxononanoate synthase [Myxococcaceae]MBF5041659.1 8-amino-7-oxononanoate synthase [Simulacricoccus sp. 17bor-14]MRI87443.1 8-amino-7-oxononanoate synthase [Aggregicoccus sp. 17bor-14]
MPGATITVTPQTITEGGRVKLQASPAVPDSTVKQSIYAWSVERGQVEPLQSTSDRAEWDTTGLTPGGYIVRVSLLQFDAQAKLLHSYTGEEVAVVEARPGVSPAPAATSSASLSASAGAGGSAPTGSPAAAASPSTGAPAAGPAPGASAAPGAGASPAASAAPGTSSAPGGAASPGASTSPGSFSSPTASASPGAAAAPVATVAPAGPTAFPPGFSGASAPLRSYAAPETGTPLPGAMVAPGAGGATLASHDGFGETLLRGGPLPVALRRTSHAATTDEILWMIIRRSTDALSFGNYVNFIDEVLCREGSHTDTHAVHPHGVRDAVKAVKHSRMRLPFPGVDAYRRLKSATEAFMMVNCGVMVDLEELMEDIDLQEEEARLELPLGGAKDPLKFLGNMWSKYLEDVNGTPDAALPYLAICREKLPDVPLTSAHHHEGRRIDCVGIIREKLALPCFLELIWNYWHEEGMLAQTLNYISQRFQNVGAEDGNGLLNMEIDPLRPLNNLLWGYIQDEQNRLSVARRASEYAHQYGFPLHGRAVAGQRAAERRSKFLESFHTLLHRCVQFFRQDDDTTVVADGFPVLNAIKETHYLLAQGAHNQFGDLPSTARQEMLVQQWLLSRPEMREFFGGRVMVPYPEAWMDRVDAMKSLQGWTDVSVVHFHDLAVFGEQLLLSVRYGGWSLASNPNQAANWARYWRAEIQGYIHAYRAATGVDLTAEVTDARHLSERYVPPSVHLRNRLALQAQTRRH